MSISGLGLLGGVRSVEPVKVLVTPGKVGGDPADFPLPLSSNASGGSIDFLVTVPRKAA